MKSVMQAMWALIVSCGNVLVILVIQIRGIERKVWTTLWAESNQLLKNDYVVIQATEFFVFAGIMGAATVVFAALASRYTYADAAVADNVTIENLENCTSSKSLSSRQSKLAKI